MANATITLNIKPKFPVWVIYVGAVILHLPTKWFFTFDVEGL